MLGRRESLRLGLGYRSGTRSFLAVYHLELHHLNHFTVPLIRMSFLVIVDLDVVPHIRTGL